MARQFIYVIAFLLCVHLLFGCESSGWRSGKYAFIDGLTGKNVLVDFGGTLPPKTIGIRLDDDYERDYGVTISWPDSTPTSIHIFTPTGERVDLPLTQGEHFVYFFYIRPPRVESMPQNEEHSDVDCSGWDQD
jgi:hypothetical protein